MKKGSKKKFLTLGIIIVLCLIVAFLWANWSQIKWKYTLKKASSDFALVLTQEIAEKTIDDFLFYSSRSYRPYLQDLNWSARENFLKFHSPWDSDKYNGVAYATFTAWDGDSEIKKESYADYYFKSAKVSTSVAKPFLKFRKGSMDIAKRYLSKPENLDYLFGIYKPLLVEKFKGNAVLLETAKFPLKDYLKNGGVNISEYEREFFQRRESEGGKVLLEKYLQILEDLSSSIYPHNITFVLEE